MSPRDARVAWSLATVTVALLLASGALAASGGSAPLNVTGIVLILAFAAYAVVGAVVLSRRPGHPVGRWFLVLGLGGAVTIFTAGWAEHVPLLPGRMVAAWITSWSWSAFVVPIAFVFLTFPDGTYQSRRWRWVARLAWLTIAVFVIGGALSPTLHVSESLDLPNPIGIEALRDTPLEEGAIGWLFAFIALPTAAASIVVRFRRARGEERQQLKWLAFAAAVLAIGFVTVSLLSGDEEPSDLALLPMFLGMLLFPFATGLAILRYRLYDIDVVINKAVVYGGLAAFITGVYVAVAVGVGTLVGAGDEPNVALQVAATALVAIAFQPVRQRVQRFANRLVYGPRATPYEVMSEFSERVAGALAVRDALREMAQAAAEGIRAAHARVRLFLPRGERAVEWPEDASHDGAFDVAIPVRHIGEEIGEIAVRKAPGDPVTPAERALLDDLAAQAGLAMHNVRLAEELSVRAQELAEQSEQLRRSRERLITARDVQRRRLERDIREGPHRQLLTIGGRIRDASAVLEREPEAAAAVLDELGGQANDTLEGLRDLARGIFPPLLADRGIVPALEAHIRMVGANAVVEAEPGLIETRFDPDTEAAVYFCCLQAIQNVMRHADNARTSVMLSERDGELAFAISDEGRGFDPERVPRGMGLQIMQDRVDALGGELTVASAPGAGTTVAGRLPIRALAGVDT
jgi:signal transduction histidine kinase